MKCWQENYQLQQVLNQNKQEHQFVQQLLQPKKVSFFILLIFTIELKLYNKVPPNGLVLFCGVIEMGDGKTEKKIMIDIEPFK
jgi:peptide subunit release factor 1 (eRF1)